MIQFTERDYALIVDIQEDFINGPLGSEHAKSIVEPMARFIKQFPGQKIFTRDTHDDNYLNTQEGRNLPIVHTKIDTPGWQIVEPIRSMPELSKKTLILNKDTFGSDSLFQIMRTWTEQIRKPENLYVFGLKTSLCVLSNVVIAKTASPETQIHVIEPLCSCVTKASHDRAIESMKMLQCDIIDKWES